MMKTPLAERFWPKVDRRGDSECWPWLAFTERSGYGRVAAEGLRAAPILAHRVAYELLIGPIPDGLVIDHLCRVRNCVNPAHMEPVTLAENKARGIRSPTNNQCVNGHEYTPENTRRIPRRDGGTARRCRICAAESNRRRRVVSDVAS